MKEKGRNQSLDTIKTSKPHLLQELMSSKFFCSLAGWEQQGGHGLSYGNDTCPISTGSTFCLKKAAIYICTE